MAGRYILFCVSCVRKLQTNIRAAPNCNVNKHSPMYVYICLLFGKHGCVLRFNCNFIEGYDICINCHY